MTESATEPPPRTAYAPEERFVLSGQTLLVNLLVAASHKAQMTQQIKSWLANPADDQPARVLASHLHTYCAEQIAVLHLCPKDVRESVYAAAAAHLDGGVDTVCDEGCPDAHGRVTAPATPPAPRHARASDLRWPARVVASLLRAMPYLAGALLIAFVMVQLPSVEAGGASTRPLMRSPSSARSAASAPYSAARSVQRSARAAQGRGVFAAVSATLIVGAVLTMAVWETAPG